MPSTRLRPAKLWESLVALLWRAETPKGETQRAVYPGVLQVTQLRTGECRLGRSVLLEEGCFFLRGENNFPRKLFQTNRVRYWSGRQDEGEF